MNKMFGTVKPNRIDSILNWLRKKRTLSFKLVFFALIIEDILTSKKPRELNPLESIDTLGLLGAILIIIGASLRFWARGYFTKGKLFTGGPYAIIRHPLYVGSSLAIVGTLCILNDWLNWVVIIPILLLFHGAAIIYEEKSLEKRFGNQWLEYKGTVPAIIPSFSKHLPLITGELWSWQVYCNTTEKIATIMFLILPVLLEILEETCFKG